MDARNCRGHRGGNRGGHRGEFFDVQLHLSVHTERIPRGDSICEFSVDDSLSLIDRSVLLVSYFASKEWAGYLVNPKIRHDAMTSAVK